MANDPLPPPVPCACTHHGASDTNVNHRRAGVRAGVVGAAAFALACSLSVTSETTVGSVRFSVSAAGEARDTAFLLTIDADTTSYEVYADSVWTFSASEGTHSFELGGVADNCSVQGDNPRSVEVVAGRESDASFGVTCTLNGSAKVTIATTGDDIDDMYTLDFNSGLLTVPVGPNQFVTLSLPVGGYVVALSGVANNCTVSGDNPIPMEVTAEGTATASFAIACIAS